MHNVPYVSIQLVFASGSVSLGLLDEMLLPRYTLSGAPIYLRVYMRTFRPILVAFVKVSSLLIILYFCVKKKSQLISN